MNTSIDLWLPHTQPEGEAQKWSSEVDLNTAYEHAETAAELAEYLTAITGYYSVALELLRRNKIEHRLDDALQYQLPELLFRLREIRLDMESGLKYAKIAGYVDNRNNTKPL